MNNSFCSWSGGKDSCFALYSALKQGFNVKKLLTMFTENDHKSRSHGLTKKILTKQAASLGITLHTCSTSWSDYEKNFLKTIDEFKKDGIEIGIFGDIDIKEHRQWVEKVCAEVNMEAYLPLWEIPRNKLINEFINSDFKALIVTVRDDVLGQEYLGEIISEELVSEFNKLGIDPAGENGEYHTCVIDGPIFEFPLKIKKEKINSHQGYSFLEISLKNQL